MGLNFSKYMSTLANRLRPSEVREFLKYARQPGFISFGGGMPSPEAFPMEEIKEILEEVFKSYGTSALQYVPTEGIREFREVLAEYMEKKLSISVNSIDEVVVTTGSQQAIELATQVLMDDEDVVFAEDPVYLAALNVFKKYDLNVVPVEMDEEGLSPDALEEELKKGKKPKILYTVPTFQNPTGRTMGEKRRKRLVDLAHEYDFLIIEDDPYSRLRYEGNDVKPLKHYDDEGRVMYTSTLSKILAPGFRLGWVVAHPELVRKIALAKQAADLCSESLGQFVSMVYIRDHYLESHLPKIISLYKEKRDAMLKALEEHFPEEAKWTRPKGGMFIWVTMPDGINTKELLPKALERKVIYVSGKAFRIRPVFNEMRLNFTMPTLEQIEKGIGILGELFKEEIAKLS